MIGRITRVPLRDVWKHEAKDFTKWLQDNIDVLNEILDFEITRADTEQPAGDFYVDLVARDDEGNPVVIENQLGKSDNDHLGKIITYMTAVEANKAIWIVADPRPEHIKAVAWLNESIEPSFYLMKIEAVKIGESSPALLLTPIVWPTEESRNVGTTKKQMAETDILLDEFWKGLLERARRRTKLHANITPYPGSSWLSTGAGKSGLALSYLIRQTWAMVDLYIDRGKDAEEENKKIFDEISEKKAEIERAFGEPLEWQRLEGKRACRIGKKMEIGGYRDPKEKWPEIQDKMVDAMIRLDQALRPYIEKLKT